MTEQEAFNSAVENYSVNKKSEACYFWSAALEWARTEQKPVYAFRRKGLDYFCTCTAERFFELSQKPQLFEVKLFYAHPAPDVSELVEALRLSHEYVADFLLDFDQKYSGHPARARQRDDLVKDLKTIEQVLVKWEGKQ